MKIAKKISYILLIVILLSSQVVIPDFYSIAEAKSLNDMKAEVSSIPNIYFNDIFKETRDDIIFLIKTTKNQINLIYTLSALKILEDTYYNRISYFLEKCEKKYCKKYNITLGNIKLERYSLKKLSMQLEKIKEEQNAFSIEELLDKELGKYIYYSGYQVIKNLIEKIKNDIIKKNSNVMDTKENIINEFNKRVLIEFKEYYKRLEILNKFKKMNLTKIEQKKILTQLEENITKAEIFEFFVNRMKEELETTSSLKKTQKSKDNKYNNNNNKIYKENNITKDYNINKEIYPKYKIKKKI